MSKCRKGPQDKLRLVLYLIVNFAILVNMSYRQTSKTRATLDKLEESRAFIFSVRKWSVAYIT